MSRIYDALRRVEAQKQHQHFDEARAERPHRVLTITSNKGGVGKTTLSTNLAVYFRALREDLPTLYIGLDEQNLADRMFGFGPEAPEQTVVHALRSGSLDPAIQLGQYGVHYVPSSPEISELKRELRDPSHMQRMLERSSWRGLVVVDTKSDLEILTRNAIAAADLTLVVVKDHASLIEAQRVFDLLTSWKRPWDRARILLSLVDLRVKFSDDERRDVLALLLSEIRRRGLPLLEGFVSRSPRVEGLYTNPEGRAVPILQGASGTLVHRQMRHLAQDLLQVLDVEAAS